MSERVLVLAVGKLKTPFAEAAALYEERLRSGITVRVEEVAAEPSSRDAGRASRREAERLRARIPARAWRVALDPGARPPSSSEDLARWLARRVEDQRPLCLLVGGADGLEAALVDECEERLSLGPLTMPHQLARVVLLEQLYRAACIHSGHPYPR